MSQAFRAFENGRRGTIALPKAFEKIASIAVSAAELCGEEEIYYRVV